MHNAPIQIKKVIRKFHPSNEKRLENGAETSQNVFAQWHISVAGWQFNLCSGAMCIVHIFITYIMDESQTLTLLRFWLLASSDKMVFNKNACTGAITAQGPPCRWTKADGSLSLNSKPMKKRDRMIH